jgi:hypothetical protein
MAQAHTLIGPCTKCGHPIYSDEVYNQQLKNGERTPFYSHFTGCPDKPREVPVVPAYDEGTEWGKAPVSVPSYDAPPTLEQVQAALSIVCKDLCKYLQGKNKAYGNSALDPVRIFCKADPSEQLRVRMDDKMSRLIRGQAAGEDVERDLLGYLVLVYVHRYLTTGLLPSANKA